MRAVAVVCVLLILLIGVFFLKHYNVNDMSGMFKNSKATTLDLSSFTTSDVTNMSDMFNDSSETVDLSRFKIDRNNLEDN